MGDEVGKMSVKMQGRKRVTMARAGAGDGMQVEAEGPPWPGEAASPRDKERMRAHEQLAGAAHSPFATGLTVV